MEGIPTRAALVLELVAELSEGMASPTDPMEVEAALPQARNRQEILLRIRRQLKWLPTNDGIAEQCWPPWQSYFLNHRVHRTAPKIVLRQNYCRSCS